MENTDIYFKMIDKERNIYELSELFEQNRKNISEYIQYLSSPAHKEGDLELKNNAVVCKQTGTTYPISNNVVNFVTSQNNRTDWEKLNKQFLNYHKSLSVYTLINSAPLINYASLKSGIGNLKNIRVIDVGGGTGHSLATFFQFPDTIDYYLLDPNLRLLHDQFLRFYPKLSYLKIGHILAFAENIPFKKNTFDLVLSISAIDHLNDYNAFIAEAERILKPGGILFITSHLDISANKEDATTTKQKLFTFSRWERIARFLYYRKYKVGKDDHTYHFENTRSIEEALEKNNFRITKKEIFKRYFYIVAKKNRE